MTLPLILTAEMGRDDFAWLNSLRSSHYPAERNHVPAHLTLFHQLPPSAEMEVCGFLPRLVDRAAPRAMICGIFDLGSGTAFRIASDDLDDLREEIASHFHGLLSAQDSHGWIPHVTIQNKVPRKKAIELARSLEANYVGRPLRIMGLTLHRYCGGPWEKIRSWPFRGAS